MLKWKFEYDHLLFFLLLDTLATSGLAIISTHLVRSSTVSGTKLEPEIHIERR